MAMSAMQIYHALFLSRETSLSGHAGRAALLYVLTAAWVKL
jgi:hypothetical protein